MGRIPVPVFFLQKNLKSCLTNNIIWRIVCAKGYYTTYSIIRKRIGGQMVFNTGAALLDAIVLAVVSKEPEGTYGYKITQDVRQVIELSESTLYPVLRRLQKDECLEVYDMECAGRNRRYYKVTPRGWAQLQLYENEWRSYAEKINSLFERRI